jgi:hypothetical protein
MFSITQSNKTSHYGGRLVCEGREIFYTYRGLLFVWSIPAGSDASHTGCVFLTVSFLFIETLNCPRPLLSSCLFRIFYDRPSNGKKFFPSYRGRFNTDSSDSRDNIMKKKKQFNIIRVLQYNSYLSNINSIRRIRLTAEKILDNCAPSYNAIKNY